MLELDGRRLGYVRHVGIVFHEVHEGGDGGDCGQQRLRVHQQRHDSRQKLRLEANARHGRVATVADYDAQVIQNVKRHGDQIGFVIALALIFVL